VCWNRQNAQAAVERRRSQIENKKRSERHPCWKAMLRVHGHALRCGPETSVASPLRWLGFENGSVVLVVEDNLEFLQDLGADVPLRICRSKRTVCGIRKHRHWILDRQKLAPLVYESNKRARRQHVAQAKHVRTLNRESRPIF